MENKQEKLGVLAKENLVRFARLMDSHLEEYWNSEIKNNFGFNETQKDLVKKMLLHAKEHNLRGAKRARASFVWYGYLLGQKLPPEAGRQNSRNLEGETGEIWEVCEAVEIVHTALLMHDDFMDKDRVRRGAPTTHEYFGGGHYGDTMAVNMGDVVLNLGFERLVDSGFEEKKIQKAMKQMFRGITNTAFGQAYDTSLSKIIGMSDPTLLKLRGASEKVMSLHRAKTAIYTYENPLVIGAILAGVSEPVLDILREYSKDSGIAFQLQDDILGVFGDEEKTGKSADSDLLQGKVTLLVVKALELGSKEQRDGILSVWGKPKATKKDILEAKRVIRESGSYDYSVKVASDLNWKAVKTITKLRELGVNMEAVDYLEGIAQYMLEREV